MKQVLFAIALFFAAPTFATAQNVEIQSTIQQQFDAFKSGDLDTAFGIAGPTIQLMFGTPNRFAQMVENGYPMVWRPSSVEFLDLQTINGALYQRVLVQDVNGVFFTIDYNMSQIDGDWRINGVQVLPAVEYGV